MDIDLKLTKKEKRNNRIFDDSMIKRTIKRQNSNGKLIRNFSNKSYEIEFYCLLMNMKLLRKFNFIIILFNI